MPRTSCLSQQGEDAGIKKGGQIKSASEEKSTKNDNSTGTTMADLGIFILPSGKRPCGPDSERLQLSLRKRGIKNVTFQLGEQMFLHGDVMDMGRLKNHEIPGRDTGLEWYKLRLGDVCFQHHPLQRTGIRELRDFIYCSGPASKN